MKGCIDVLLDRRSVSKFTDQDITRDVLDRILTAGLRAPAPGGSVQGGYRGAQPYSIIVVRDRKRRKQLNEMLCEGRKKAIEEAPVALIFCVDTHRLNRWAALHGGAAHYKGVGVLWVALRAVYTVAQNVLIAAESLGLGSQYVQEIVWQPYQTLDFFKLPKQVLPVAMLIMGHPAERPPLAPSLPLEAVVHEETYKDPTNEELGRYHEALEEYFQEWYRGLAPTSKVRRHLEASGVKTLAQYVSLITYTESFYKWRDDMVRTNITLSELE
ncbi:MAG: nitroreductase family protein [Candidatus Eisenbacteria bacterium]|nr:nitroreductase family protein [Candidatus Eisenbacteria bacterium]